MRPSVIAGVILAGGQSRRMGGGDKGLLDLGGRPMLARVMERLGPQVGPMAINANGDASRFAAFGLTVLPDDVPDFPGPLAGVLAGLRWAARSEIGAEAIVTVSADAPFLPRTLVTTLAAAEAARPGAIAIARSGGEMHPVIGLWPTRHADDLEAALRAGTRKVLAWTDRHGTLPVDFPMLAAGGETIDPFFNANTPEELDDARRLFHLANGA